ncbi:MAG TPA: hypothetical protein VNS32_20005, partial [Flavisolibacter sp.]|nr:hypothetical protein [Flavisolibacter sp.]
MRCGLVRAANFAVFFDVFFLINVENGNAVALVLAAVNPIIFQLAWLVLKAVPWLSLSFLP